MKQISMKKVCAIALSSLVVCLSAPLGVINAQNDALSSECKITEQLLEKLERSEEKIPVYLWYKDIDHSMIEQAVSTKLGFTIDDIENDFEAPNPELIDELNKAANGDPQNYLSELMRNHLIETDKSRRSEKEKTDQYIDLLYNELNNEYKKQSNEIINDYHISSDDVLFSSKFSPLIIAELSPSDIYSISNDAKVEIIDYYKDIVFEPCAINFQNCMEEMGIDDICEDIELSGDGVKIGIYDEGNVSVTQDQLASDYNLDITKVSVVGNPDDTGGHATYVASIAAGRDGVAPDADIVSASACALAPNNEPEITEYNTYHSLNNLEALISSHVDIINCCVGANCYRGIYNNDYYPSFEKYIDDIISSSRILIVKSAGNEMNNPISAFGLAFNTITVNSFCEDYILPYSYNHGNGCYKPDVIASTFDQGGTSSSAPVITGMLALLYQYKPNLKLHPEAVKAILIGSVHEKKHKYLDSNLVDFHQINESLSSGLTDMQGAGAPNLYRMISMVAQHSYGYGVLNSTTGYSRDIHIRQPKYGASNINVSMSFIQTNITASIPSSADNYGITLSNPSFQSDKSSNKAISSTEMIYTNLSDNNDYMLNISKYSGSMNNVKYGYAWSTDNTSYYANPYMNGIYYIKNAKSGKYLTLNTNSNNAYQNSFTGTDNQLWIVDRSSGTDDNIKSAGGNDASLEIGNLISNSYYYAIPQSTDSLVFLISNDDGTFSLEKQHSYNWFKLGIFNNSTNNGASAAWYNSSDTNLSQRWYFEAVEYKKGDVNHDGEINQSDATIITNMYSNPQNTYTNIERYLADYDSNGVINAADVSALPINN